MTAGYGVVWLWPWYRGVETGDSWGPTGQWAEPDWRTIVRDCPLELRKRSPHQCLASTYMHPTPKPCLLCLKCLQGDRYWQSHPSRLEYLWNDWSIPQEKSVPHPCQAGFLSLPPTPFILGMDPRAPHTYTSQALLQWGKSLAPVYCIWGQIAPAMWEPCSHLSQQPPCLLGFLTYYFLSIKLALSLNHPYANAEVQH